jgi:hypothetical protein
VSIDFQSRYLALNASYGDPFSLALSQRGHYSEVNCLLAAMAYGLMKQRRLIVDETNFEGLRWQDLHASTLPGAPAEVIAAIDPEWAMLDHDTFRFGSIRRRVARRHRRRYPLWIAPLGLVCGLFPIMRMLADAFCQPNPAAPPPAIGLPPAFATFHIRRGDKIRGSLVDGKRLIPEGENTAIARYLALLREKAPALHAVQVMTDDYGAVEELRALAPDLQVESLCPPAARGYEQTEFSASSVAQKLSQRRQLIAETELAIRSSLFIGGLQSNVGRFIVLRHQNHRACISIDKQRSWYPG